MDWGVLHNERPSWVHLTLALPLREAFWPLRTVIPRCLLARATV